MRSSNPDTEIHIRAHLMQKCEHCLRTGPAIVFDGLTAHESGKYKRFVPVVRPRDTT